MNITVQDMLIDILRVCRVVEKSETPESDELANALRSVNMMLNTWSDRSLMIQGSVRTGFALTAGTASYTIGSGGAFNTTKPQSITSAYTRDSGNNDKPLGIISQADYNAKPDKAIAQASPDELVYDPGAAQQATPLGTVTVYPIPDSSTTYTLYLDMFMPLTEFVNQSDTITFDKGAYYEAIKYNGAKRVWGEYYGPGIPFPPDERELAAESMRVLENINSRQVIAGMDIPSRSGGYNIYSDEG